MNIQMLFCRFSTITMILVNIAFCGEIQDAATKGDLGKVKALLANNPELINGKDRGSTPLFWAACMGHKEIVELLLVNKADVNSRADEDGSTPMHAAASQGRKDMVQLLLTNKAEVDIKNSSNKTPLHFAAEEGRKDVVELLITNKADVNGRDNEGFTPLLYATSRGHAKVVEVLLANKADRHAKADKGLYAGKTAIQLATESKRADIATLLLQQESPEVQKSDHAR